MISGEVSPERHHVHEVQGYYLHTNHYLNLTDVEQAIGPSSRARLARAGAICQAAPPTQMAQVLSLLGDEADHDYPIYRRASPPDRGATLCSALFDLDDRQLRIYRGHPIKEPGRTIAFNL